MISIEAIDTIFFRDGKPFNKDGDNWVNSLFPPAPSVFYGALRSAYFAENIPQFDKVNTYQDPTQNLRIKGIFMQAGETVYFPLPLDLVKDKDKDEEVFPLVLRGKDNIVSNCPTEKILWPPAAKRVENVEEGILDDISFSEYLSRYAQRFPFRRLSDFIIREPKIGIGLNKTTGTAQDEFLYRVGMIRLEASYAPNKRRVNLKTRKLKILLDYEGLSLPSQGLIKLGGESKAASYQLCENEEVKKIKTRPAGIKGNRFKVYLAAPAKFANGWLPGWVDERTLIGVYKGISLKILTAAIGKHVSIGGFDMKEKQPKPMFRAVPAGSVYYFEILDNSDLEQVIDVFHYENISDFDAQQGFGLAFVGGIS